MKAHIKINPLATKDLEEIKTHISEENEDIAIRVVKQLIEKIEILSLYPEIGSKFQVNKKYRYLVCDNYLIFYFYRKETVFIQRVLHSKRDYINLLKNNSDTGIVNEIDNNRY